MLDTVAVKNPFGRLGTAQEIAETVTARQLSALQPCLPPAGC